MWQALLPEWLGYEGDGVPHYVIRKAQSAFVLVGLKVHESVYINNSNCGILWRASFCSVMLPPSAARRSVCQYSSNAPKSHDFATLVCRYPGLWKIKYLEV